MEGVGKKKGRREEGREREGEGGESREKREGGKRKRGRRKEERGRGVRREGMGSCRGQETKAEEGEGRRSSPTSPGQASPRPALWGGPQASP